MANELVHGSVGTTMTQAEFEAVGLHVCNSQATGDLIYASSATQLSRLAIGTGVLYVSGGVPTWTAAPTLTSPTINGTIATTGLTLPAITLGGNITGNSKTITGLSTITLITGTAIYSTVANSYIVYGGGSDVLSYFMIFGSSHASFPGEIRLVTANASSVETTRLKISGVVNTATASWTNCKHVFDATSLPNGDPAVAGQLYYTAADGIVRRSAG